MTTIQPDYFTAYSSLKMARDARGVLVVEFHTKGGPLTFTARDHTAFVDAFYRIGQDRANAVVIFTGTGGHFIAGIDFASFGNVADPGVWSQVHDEGVQILENLLNIRVPVIAAVEGRLDVHSEYALIANVIVAGGRITSSNVRFGTIDSTARRPSVRNRRVNGPGATPLTVPPVRTVSNCARTRTCARRANAGAHRSVLVDARAQTCAKSRRQSSCAVSPQPRSRASESDHIPGCQRAGEALCQRGVVR